MLHSSDTSIVAENQNWDVIVCGAGPTGLAVANEALKANLKVLIIESREKMDSTLRSQGVAPLPQTKSYLSKLFKKNDPILKDYFFSNQNKSFLLAIKDIQRAMTRAIEDNKSCTFMYGTHATQVSMGKGEITIKQNMELQEKKLTFKHLVDATGSNHAISNLLKDTSHEIKHIPITSHEDTNYIIAYFKATARTDKIPLDQDEIVQAVRLPNHFVFIYYVERNSYFKSGGKVAKFHIIASIPNEEKKSSSKEETQSNVEENQLKFNYLKNCAEMMLPMCHIEFKKSKKIKKEKLNLLSYNTKQYEAEIAFREVNGHTFTLAGDAFRTPDFHQGHGLNDGLMHAVALGKLFRKKIDLETYHDTCKERSFTVSSLLIQSEFKNPPTTAFLKEVINKLHELIMSHSITQEERKALSDLHKELTSKFNFYDALPELKNRILQTQQSLEKLSTAKDKTSTAIIFIKALINILESTYIARPEPEKDYLSKKELDLNKALENLEKEKQDRILQNKQREAQREPLFIKATRENNLEKIKQLVSENKEDINALDKNGNSALIIATHTKKYDIINALITAKANLNIQGLGEMSALHYAAQNGNPYLVKKLIEEKADTTLMCRNVFSYLRLLSLSIIDLLNAKNYLYIKDILEFKNIDLNTSDPYRDSPNNPIQAIKDHLREYVSTEDLISLNLLKELFSENFNKIINEKNVPLLFYAAGLGKLNVCQWLIESGIDKNQRSLTNMTFIEKLDESIAQLTKQKNYQQICQILNFIGKAKIKNKGAIFYCMEDCIRNNNLKDLKEFKKVLTEKFFQEFLARKNKFGNVIEQLKLKITFSNELNEILSISAAPALHITDNKNILFPSPTPTSQNIDQTTTKKNTPND